MRKGLTGDTSLSKTGTVYGSISTSLAAYSTKLVTTALEGSYAQGEKDVSPKHLKAAAELLTLRRDAIRVIDAQGQKEEEKDKKQEPPEEPQEPNPK